MWVSIKVGFLQGEFRFPDIIFFTLLTILPILPKIWMYKNPNLFCKIADLCRKCSLASFKESKTHNSQSQIKLKNNTHKRKNTENLPKPDVTYKNEQMKFVWAEILFEMKKMCHQDYNFKSSNNQGFFEHWKRIIKNYKFISCVTTNKIVFLICYISNL